MDAESEGRAQVDDERGSLYFRRVELEEAGLYSQITDMMDGVRDMGTRCRGEDCWAEEESEVAGPLISRMSGPFLSTGLGMRGRHKKLAQPPVPFPATKTCGVP